MSKINATGRTKSAWQSHCPIQGRKNPTPPTTISRTFKEAMNPMVFFRTMATYKKACANQSWFLGLPCLGVLASMAPDPARLVGVYKSSMKNDHVDLKLRDDSTYSQRWSSCTFKYKAKGRWTTRGDTLWLEPAMIKAKRAQSQSERVVKQYVPGYLIRSDTLYTLINRKGQLGTWFPLFQKE